MLHLTCIAKRSSKLDARTVQLSQDDQSLFLDMNKLWLPTRDNMELQNKIIKCLKCLKKSLYLGGGHEFDPTTYLKVTEGCAQNIRLLKCDHEETDDIIMYHISHAVSVDKLLLLLRIQMFFMSHHYVHWTNNGKKE